jgi:hypothetical protein
MLIPLIVVLILLFGGGAGDYYGRGVLVLWLSGAMVPGMLR